LNLTEEEANETFLKCVKNIEGKVIETVSLVTGDREFPEEWREKIQGIIAKRAVRGTGGVPNPKEEEWVRVTRTSQLLMDLHSAFHRVAQEGFTVRFGRITDNPQVFLAVREDHDKEVYGNLEG
jgi:hypothetical protein